MQINVLKGERIQERLNQLGLSQAQFAQWLSVERGANTSVTQAAVHNWLRGKSAPHLSNLVLMCQLLDLSYDDVLPTTECDKQSE